jgi:hypothetical protein
VKLVIFGANGQTGRLRRRPRPLAENRPPSRESSIHQGDIR